MNFRMQTFAPLLAAAAVISGCDCGSGLPPKSTFGEVQVVYMDGEEQKAGREAVYDFGIVFGQQEATLNLVILNADRGSLTLLGLEKVEGDAVKIGDVLTEASPLFHVDFKEGAILGAGEAMEIAARFTPPKLEVAKDFRVTLLLRVAGARKGEETATITLVGRGIPGACDLPATLDFGNVAVDDVAQISFEVRNETELPVDATVGELYSTSGDHAAYGFAPESARGTFTLDTDQTRSVTIDFRPTEEKSYLAFLKARASDKCPEETITVTGSGVGQVLSWTPARVDFGYVTPGVRVEEKITFLNSGTREVSLGQIHVLNPNEFGVVAPAGGELTRLTVPGATKDSEGQWVAGTAVLAVYARPGIIGPRQTQVHFNTDLSRQPSGSVPLEVFGGGPDIQVIPSANLNFGKVAYFSTVPTSQTRKLTVLNVGTAPAIPDPMANLRLADANGDTSNPVIEITALNQDSSPTELVARIPNTYDPDIGLEATAGKGSVNLELELTPQSVGMKQWEVKIYSNDPDEPVTRITVAAHAVVLPPCNYTVSPTTLSFGLIGPPNHRDLAFTIKNNGINPSDVCLISGLDLGPNTYPFFSLPAGPLPSYELQPGETKQVVVRVWPQGQTPSGVTTITGTVEFYMSSDSRPKGTVVLNAQLASSCLTIAPADLDYGTVEVGCSSQTRVFTAYNNCQSTTVTINDIALQNAGGQPAGGPNCPGSAACPEFHIIQSPPTPLTLTSSPVTFSVKYRPIDFGADSGAIALSATQGGQSVTYVVSLEGQGASEGIQTDVYTQDAKPKADILLVIDNSGSMSPYQAALAANFQSFIKYATSAQVDFHIAVIHTEKTGQPAAATYGKFIAGPGEGCTGCASFPEKILTPTTPNLEQKFKDKVNVGDNYGNECEAEPALMALTAPLVNSDNAGFLREDAALAIVAVTDEPDHSPNTTSYYLNGFWNIKGFNKKTMFSFNAIAGFSSACPGDSGELNYYVTQTNGVKDDICTPDWSKTLEKLGKIAFGFRTNFFLTSVPDLTKGPIEVRIDGDVIPPVDERSATVWTFDSVGNSVNFEPMYVPEPGQTLTITYHVTCYP